MLNQTERQKTDPGPAESKSRISGYQIQIAADKKFTKNKKTVTVKGYNKISKRVTKLKGGKKCYSAWSKAKKVRSGK